MNGHPTPEAAAVADDSVPEQFARVVAVDRSPDGRFAIVCVEYNEPPAVEPYVVLCERGPGGWTAGHGGSGGGLTWMSTSADGAVGVEVAWGRSAPSVRWGVPGSHGG